jgi:hypothetical protein
MGSSGMKRKGRRHLAKVGTRPQVDQELEDRRQVALHPFSEDPLGRRRRGVGLAAALVGVGVAVGVVAIAIAT